jgi:hypothetical protein
MRRLRRLWLRRLRRLLLLLDLGILPRLLESRGPLTLYRVEIACGALAVKNGRGRNNDALRHAG